MAFATDSVTSVYNDADTLDRLLAFKNNRSESAIHRPTTQHFATDAGLIFAGISVVIGSIAILLNGTILSILLSRRRQIFSHVFYVLIFNFALIDMLKGSCAILWSIKTLQPPGSPASVLIFKIDQVALMLLRFSNLATIMNLLMITLNEYLFIVYPLRRRAIILVVVSWILAWTFTIVMLLLGSSQKAVYINPHCKKQGLVPAVDQMQTTETDGNLDRFRRQIGDLKKIPSTAISTVTENLHATVIEPVPSKSPNCFIRSDTSKESQVVFSVSIIFFCFACLVITVICYTILFRVISKIIKQDVQIMAEAIHYHEQGVARLSNGGAGDTKRLNRQLLKRHKYVLVIGTVIVIYTVYLFSYSALQLLQLGRLTSSSMPKWKLIYLKWVLQTLICTHSVLQPLCYFRMTEFRQIVIRYFCQRCRRSSIITENMYVSSSEHHVQRHSSADTIALNGRRPSTSSPLNNNNRWETRRLLSIEEHNAVPIARFRQSEETDSATISPSPKTRKKVCLMVSEGNEHFV